MANRFVRSSKFRHVFGTTPKKDLCYDNIKITKAPHESNMSAVNSKFVAVVLEAQGGGAFMVIPIKKMGRLDINYPKVSGHKNLVLVIEWNPFNDYQIASGSEDCTIKIWNIPEDGLTGNLEAEDAVSTLTGHLKKVLFLAWHPSAADVLLSASADNKIIIWNTKTATSVLKLSGLHPEMIQSVCWNYNGSCFATTCKDKKLRVIDPRKKEVVSEGAGHEGTKPSKVLFCGKTNKLFTSGYSRMSERQYALWDPTDLGKPLVKENIDTNSGVLFPYFDEGTGMVYLIGKGDTQIRFFEVTDKAPYVFFLSMFSPTGPQRGACAMPKRHLDFMKCEVMRFYRLTNKNSVEPVPMTVPRKSDLFQDDIYPPCEAGVAALTAEEWFEGQNKDPRLVQFTEEGCEPLPEGDYPIYNDLLAAKAEKKAPSVLKRLGSPQPEGGRPMPVSHEEYRKAYKELLEENAALKERLAKLEGK